jgi:hypothetical protein
MIMNDKSWQSAVSGIQAENISIGDINQSIINSSSNRYNHIGVIISEYNRKIIKLDRSYKDRIRFNQKSLCKQCQDYLKELEKKIRECEQTIESNQQSLKKAESTFNAMANQVEAGEDYDSDKLSHVISNLLISAGTAYMFHGDDREMRKCIEEAEKEKAEAEKDIDEFKVLIKMVENFTRINVLELDIDQILDDNSLSNLSSSCREDIELIKDAYKAQQQELDDSYEQDFEKYKIEKNLSIYREELQYCLELDGYPLSLEKMSLLESRLKSFELDEENIESAVEEITRPFVIQNLEKYKVTYQEKLNQEGYPLSEDSVEKLQALKENLELNAFFDKWDIESAVEELIRPFVIQNLENYKIAYQEKLSQEGYPLSEDGVQTLQKLREALGLNTFSFLQLDTSSIEISLVKPFYQTNFQEYQKNYREKLEEKGLALGTEDITQLDALQIRLGLKTFVFPDFDVRKAEQELIELVYQENIQKFEREYKEKLAQEGYPLSSNTVNELIHLERNLGLGSFQFPGCPNPVSIKEELVKPLYKANLQAYSQEYKQKLYQFGVNFPQANTAELEKLRGRFGFDVCYLETLGLQAIFDLEEISAIESELVKLVYQENLQSYEKEYKQKLNKEGFSLSYSTISELSHLEEVLGLGGCQLQDYPELKQIKAQWIRPFYQSNLQNYSKEYKRRLGQFGIDFAKDNASELEELRSEFGLTLAHLKNLNFQDRFFSLDTDLFILEKNAKESFYIESLQSYAQELKRESNNYLTGSLKESLQGLGIRSEDVKIVEGLVRNNWEIDHLFHERDSDASYWKLINALAQCEWQKADALTRNLLLKLADRNSKGFGSLF